MEFSRLEHRKRICRVWFQFIFIESFSFNQFQFEWKLRLNFFEIKLKLIFPSSQGSVLNYRCAEPSNWTHRNYSAALESWAGMRPVSAHVYRARAVDSRGRWIPSPLFASVSSRRLSPANSTLPLSSARRTPRGTTRDAAIIRRSFEYVPISGGLAVPREVEARVEPFCSRQPAPLANSSRTREYGYPDSWYHVCVWGFFFPRAFGLSLNRYLSPPPSRVR